MCNATVAFESGSVALAFLRVCERVCTSCSGSSLLPGLNFIHAFRAGSRSGKPKEMVTIVDCGLLDSDDNNSNSSFPKALEGQQMRAGDGLLGNSFKDVQSTIDAQPPSEPWYKFW